jgi:hypothetical protein
MLPEYLKRTATFGLRQTLVTLSDVCGFRSTELVRLTLADHDTK